MLSFKYLYMFLHICVLMCIWIFKTLWAVAQQAPLSMGFSKKAYWSGLPWPPLRNLPTTGIEPASPAPPALAGEFFTTFATWEAPFVHIALIYFHCFKIFYLVNVLQFINWHYFAGLLLFSIFFSYNNASNNNFPCDPVHMSDFL